MPKFHEGQLVMLVNDDHGLNSDVGIQVGDVGIIVQWAHTFNTREGLGPETSRYTCIFNSIEIFMIDEELQAVSE